MRLRRRGGRRRATGRRPTPWLKFSYGKRAIAASRIGIDLHAVELGRLHRGDHVVPVPMRVQDRSPANENIRNQALRNSTVYGAG